MKSQPINMSSSDEETLFATKIDDTNEGTLVGGPTHLVGTMPPTVPDINIPEHLTVTETLPNNDLNVPEIGVLELLDTPKSDLAEKGVYADSDHEIEHDDDQVPDSAGILPEHASDDTGQCRNYGDSNNEDATIFKTRSNGDHDFNDEIQDICFQSEERSKHVGVHSSNITEQKKPQTCTVSSPCSSSKYLKDRIPQFSEVDRNHSAVQTSLEKNVDLLVKAGVNTSEEQAHSEVTITKNDNDSISQCTDTKQATVSDYDNSLTLNVHENGLSDTKTKKSQNMFEFPPANLNGPAANSTGDISRQTRADTTEEGNNNSIIFHASQIQNIISNVPCSNAVSVCENKTAQLQPDMKNLNADSNHSSPVLCKSLRSDQKITTSSLADSTYHQGGDGPFNLTETVKSVERNELTSVTDYSFDHSGQNSPQVKRKHSGSEENSATKMHMTLDTGDETASSTIPVKEPSACASKTSSKNPIKYAIPMYLIVNSEDLGQNLNLADFSQGVNANVSMSFNQIGNTGANIIPSESSKSTSTTSLKCRIVPMLTSANVDGTLPTHGPKVMPKLPETLSSVPLTQVSQIGSSKESVDTVNIPKLTDEVRRKTRKDQVCSKTQSSISRPIDKTKVPDSLLTTCEKNSFSLDPYCIPESSSKKTGVGKKLDSLKFPPCTVCGGEASGFHYGCNTCEACKNFFRRCLLRKNGVTFFCSQGQNCEISFRKNKNNCSYCRYKKCLDLGMSKDKCKMGRYTYTRRTETINQVRKLEGKEVYDSSSSSSCPSSACASASTSVENSPLPSPGPSGESCMQGAAGKDPVGTYIAKHISEPAGVLSLESMDNDQLLKHLLEASEEIMAYNLSNAEIEEKCRECYLEYNRKVSLFGSLTNVSKEEYHKLLKEYGIDMGNIWERFKKIAVECDPLIARYCKFAKQIPEFTKLSFEDQSILLKTTNASFFMILMHQGFRPEYNVFMEINGQPFHIDEVADKFYSRNFIESNCRIMAYIQTLHLTQEEVALLGTIATMSGDQCTLQNHALVDRVQEQLTNILQQELVKNYGPVQGMRRFSKFIDLFVTLRDFSIQYQKEFKTMCDDPMVKKEFPNIDLMLPDDD